MAGFTLIEVTVAIAVLAITLVTVMQLFSNGLRASRASCDYTRAIVHARDKMEELSAKPVQGSGSFDDGFDWESTIEPYKKPEEMEGDSQKTFQEEPQFQLLKITVRISWYKTSQQQNSVELISMKAVSKKEYEK